MRIPKVAYILTSALLAALLFMSACAPKAPPGAQIKAEVCIDITGPYSGVCKSAALAIKDYFAYINEEKGGIRGAKVVLLEVDSKSDPGVISTHYDTAVAQGIVARLVVTSVEVMSVLSKMEADGIPSIGQAASAILFQQPSWHYSTVGDWAKQICSALDRYFYPEWKKAGGNDPMKLALICWDNTLGRSGPPAVEALMNMRPGRYQIVFTSFPPVTTMDYTTDMRQAKAANPDIVLAFVTGSACGMVARDAAKVGLPRIPIISDYPSMLNRSSVELAGPGVVYCWAYNWWPLPQEEYEVSKITRHLVEKYQRQWEPTYTNGLTTAVTFHYAAEKALQEVGYEALSGRAIKEQLDKMCNVDLGLGTLVSYCDYEGDREGPSSIRVIKWDETAGKEAVASDWFPAFTFKEFYGLK